MKKPAAKFPTSTNFLAESEDLWNKLTETVMCLCEKYGEDTVMRVIGDGDVCDSGMIAVKDGDVQFNGDIDSIAASVDGLTDFFARPKKHLYKWVAFCSDGSYEDVSEKRFRFRRDAYKDMRRAALLKMEWNTDHDDFSEDTPSIDYKVRFTPDFIGHTSYSGTYVWVVLRECDELSEARKKTFIQMTIRG